MPYGPPICACCGSADGIEAHHLFSRKAGCPDDLMVWLCHVCHGRAHGMRRRLNIGALTKVALAAAKARGVKLGGHAPASAERMRALAPAGGAARKQDADAKATDLAPAIAALREVGITTLAGMAAVLNSEGHKAPRGGTWSPSQVARLLRRLDGSTAAAAPNQEGASA